ncbi:hypothetical protein BASA83_000673 [Batrachochytrium salamandrivorans]|nr:hypothetical protein BASA81_013104 [Batrachochytrium salamandrivorans]KAH9276545.1 hypothetical protein BASA83_000673 [Batrachochytrium salamandrivorans]
MNAINRLETTTSGSQAVAPSTISKDTTITTTANTTTASSINPGGYQTISDASAHLLGATVSTFSERRLNPLGIQMLSNTLHRQIFPKYNQRITNDNNNNNVQGSSEQVNIKYNTSFVKAKTAIELSRLHLAENNLLGKNLDPLPEITLPLPPLVSKNADSSDPSLLSIEEHIRIISLEQAEPYLTLARLFVSAKLPPIPTTWVKSSGWTRYGPDGSATAIKHPPLGESLSFDVEVLYKMTNYPVIATAVSTNAWYSWCSPTICGMEKTFQDLIPFGTDKVPRIIVGHNVSYDRSRILEEYHSEPTKNAFIDTMSLHCAVSGMSTQQRHLWNKHRKSKYGDPSSDSELESKPPIVDLEEGQGIEQESDLSQEHPWITKTSVNSLLEVARLHLKKYTDKTVRDMFSATDMDQFDDPKTFQTLMSYCANDAQVAHELFCSLFPRFEKKCPHPASFAGVLHMGKSYLTVSEDWHDFIDRCDSLCDSTQNAVEKDLVALAESALLLQKDDAYKDDPWLKYLDWTPKVIRMVSAKISSKDGSILHQARPFKRSGDPFLEGKPKWFCEYWDPEKKSLSLSTGVRLAPYLLRLQWNGFPLSHCRAYGWMYRRPSKDLSRNPESLRLRLSFSSDPKDKTFDPIASFDTENAYFRIPHANGEDHNCGNPLAKAYISAFERNILTSAFPDAQHILEQHAQCTYWISSRSRINSQFVVWDKLAQPLGYSARSDKENKIGVILPQLIPMGTITRRAVEPLWMTASNAKSKRIGSEIKSMVVPPKGYSFVGADVDSEELWIASVFGDAQFGQHGSTAIGFMTLQGTKSAGSDMHSVTGRILGITRDQSKVFNYGRIYGAGLKFAVQLLLQGNPEMTREVAEEKAEMLYKSTKGQRYRSMGRFRNLWHGGTESMMFNTLDWIATYSDPRTPVLGCQIPDALMPLNVNQKFMPSRINWAVQSSGVDYLHILLISMDYLMRRLRIDGRFLISIHDEVRYIIKDEHVDLACLAMHISNLWARSMFASRLGLYDLPLNVAFFSLVDIDHCLRKEVDMSCITPSHRSPIPPGKSLTIHETIERLATMLSKENPYGDEVESVTQMVDKLRKSDGWAPSPPMPLPNLDTLRAQLCRHQQQVHMLENPVLAQRKIARPTIRSIVNGPGITTKI